MFIVGHWRSGTTLLHKLLSLDTAFCAPTFFECCLPRGFVSSAAHACRLLCGPGTSADARARLHARTARALAAMAGGSWIRMRRQDTRKRVPPCTRGRTHRSCQRRKTRLVLMPPKAKLLLMMYSAEKFRPAPVR
ncbi:MAG: sulfotransferase [Gammaproteobacteria bacterium]